MQERREKDLTPRRIVSILPLLLCLLLSTWSAASTAAPPTVTGFWPPTGGAGAIIFVFGSDFATTPGATQVKVNGVSTPAVQPFTSDLLFFMVPAGNTNEAVEKPYFHRKQAP